MNTYKLKIHTNNGGIMKRKIILIFVVFIIFSSRIIYLNYFEKDKYTKLLLNKTEKYLYGSSAPRGRILDRFGKVLVDNVGIKSLYYTKKNKITIEEELVIAKKISEIIDIDITNDKNILKKFWLINNNGDNLLTDEEYELYKLRKLSSDEVKKIKYERITDEMLNEIDKKVATIYNLMNKGYSYDKKLILKGLTDTEYSKIIDNNIDGVSTELIWDRTYNYGNVLRDIFGSVGSIPEEKKAEYLSNGYELNDIVGLSYLEYQYEDYLKGEKDLYKVNNDNSLTLLKKGRKGNDLVLSIDIDVQIKLENIIKDNIINAKKYKYTNYFSDVYSIIGDPLTGEIIALSGQKLINEKNKIFKNVNTNLINTSYTVGSVVKMATMSTGYKYGIIDINTSMNDGCIKLYQVPLKCSYKDLGRVNDLTAISKSSNYYQFKIAIGLTDNKYAYNMKLNTNINDFEKFRGLFREYGLGSITGIDLPNETIGIIGKSTNSDLLLNLSIGQYDTYTPMELFQYINTIASNGEKRKPQLMMKIINDNNVILENEYKLISKVALEEKYLERIKDAMNLATKSGTARNYINKSYNPAGKTGTSETFVDTNNDGVMDTLTTSLAFVGFAPFDNPKYSVIVLAPNLYESNDKEYSKVYITRYISRDITNFLFENN